MAISIHLDQFTNGGNPRLNGPSNVYIIQMHCPEILACKVGVARDVESRRKELQVGNPYPLIVRAAYRNDLRFTALSLESSILLHFRRRSLRGEWLEVEPRELISYANAWMYADDPCGMLA